MIKKLSLFTAALLCAAVTVFGQNQQLPNDPAVRTGKLDNGLTYYIRHNDKPAQRAEFYLATNVGAMQETADQDGLAHFLEHMCFNGTKNFPGKSILNWLESIGASFGGNVNASTQAEQTVYLLNNIPLVRPSVVDTCILIMHDYAHFVTCDPQEIDKERGVILEEKRTRRTASWRTFENSLPYLYGDTKYAGCTIIGSENNLKTFKPESLTNFYHTWYHPDMQALVVVGDVDVDKVEAIIKKTFSDIPAAQNPQKKDVISLPDNKEPVIGILTDPENSSTSVEVLWKSPARPLEMNNTVAGLMTDLVQDVVSMSMSERLNDIAAKPDAPFISSSFGYGHLCNTADVVDANVECKENQSIGGFEAMMTEIEKMRRFGFTDSEISRAKTEILSQYETNAKKAETRKNSEFVMPLINNFFKNYSYMDPNAEYEVVKQLLQQLPSQAINQFAAQSITSDNMVVIYTAPQRTGINHPTKEQLQEVISKVDNAELKQEAGEEVPTSFIDPSAKLKGSKVADTKGYLYNSVVVTLENGMKVILKHNENEKDRISFNLTNKGGLSLISDNDLYSFESNIWTLYLQNTGIAGFPATTVSKMLAGKQLSVHPYINSYTHGVSGESTKKDFETAMQLLYLYYTAPRFDKDEYSQGMTQLNAVLPNLISQPNYQFMQGYYKALYNSPRKFVISPEVAAKASLSTLEKNYRKLFNNVGNATLVIVGDFSEDDIMPMIEKYAGSLPKGSRASNWSYRKDGIVNGKVINDFKAKMETPKVTVLDVYKLDTAYSAQGEVSTEALAYILEMVYTESLRENEGGTYGASVNSGVNNAPNSSRILEIEYETNTKSADTLRALAASGFKNIADNGPTAEQFDKTVKNLKKNIPENKLRNSYWVGSIKNDFLYNFDYVSSYEEAVNNLTPEMIKEAAADLYYSGNFIETVMRPQAE